LQWCYVGIGAQNEDAIKARLFGELTHIDLEYALTPRRAALAQIPSIGGIADQRLLPAP
jgi:hypothetical protein